MHRQWHLLTRCKSICLHPTAAVVVRHAVVVWIKTREHGMWRGVAEGMRCGAVQEVMLLIARLYDGRLISGRETALFRGAKGVTKDLPASCRVRC